MILQLDSWHIHLEHRGKVRAGNLNLGIINS